ncbi:SafA/ExsA family spore coat assembly protein [Pradoshia sp. D12]|uniref:SafA/ExsA family spore coat assembly protein n=1 Tax=Bacillaceae TaxID=186817 RepID=UPI00112EB04C|nr:MULTISPECIES: SafA/ExsA family spore coat assembly protein [Bacillaceae]QFK71215.1 SafA/ExsA family spore coat assembly protein [Pradoshia sp. D12]TPF73008.1 SafA/ExsA family spore coat assembly protein [Bacillus sp. D12]
MKKKITSVILTTTLLLPTATAFADYQYTVVSGDTLWKIAVKTETGISELIAANSQISNINLIYPGQKINIPTQDDVKAYEQEVIRLVNVERAKQGLQELKYDWELARVARYKSEDMRDNNYFSHTSPVYGSPFDMMKNFGINYKSAGENIAKGQTTPEQVVNAWMNSSGHRANILSSKFTHIGVGYAKSGHIWTQQFISK